jgi:hypothetical protein
MKCRSSLDISPTTAGTCVRREDLNQGTRSEIHLRQHAIRELARAWRETVNIHPSKAPEFSAGIDSSRPCDCFNGRAGRRRPPNESGWIPLVSWGELD